MDKTVSNISIPFPIEALIRSESISESVAPITSVQEAINVHFDTVGSIKTRKGYTRLTPNSTIPSGDIISMFREFGSEEYPNLFIQIGNKIYRRELNNLSSSSPYTEILEFSVSGGKARFSQFAGGVWTVNGKGKPQVYDLDSKTYSEYTQFGADNFSDIDAGFEGRVWAAQTEEDRVYYTLVVAPDGTIAGGSDFLQITERDGEPITALTQVPRALLVFKPNSIHRIYASNNMDPYPAYNIGTYSKESIVKAKDGFYFHHSSGFYKFQYDGQPIEISKRVQDFVTAISPEYYKDVKGIYDGTDHILWSIGDVTVDNVLYKNCELRYTISTQVWTVYTLRNKVHSKLLLNTLKEIAPIFGSNNQQVYRMESGYTDDGAPIQYSLIDRWRVFSEQYKELKKISGIAYTSTNGAGANLSYQTNNSKDNEWDSIGSMSSDFVTLFPNFITDDFNRFRYKLSGETNGQPIEFLSLEISKIIIEGYKNN